VVKVRELATGREYDQPYDALVLSTGASPLKPAIPGIDRAGHFTVRNIPDVERIMAWIKDCKGCRAVVVGGGYIGLEMAEQLRHRGLGVTVVEALSQVMTPLDPEMAAWLHGELKTNGVELYLGEPVAAFEPPKAGESARASVVVGRDAEVPMTTATIPMASTDDSITNPCRWPRLIRSPTSSSPRHSK